MIWRGFSKLRVEKNNFLFQNSLPCVWGKGGPGGEKSKENRIKKNLVLFQLMNSPTVMSQFLSMIIKHLP